MTSDVIRVAPSWLALRERADAAARSQTLVARLLPRLPRSGGSLTVHDLACGTGSMGRWLAPFLDGRQQWVLHDRDADLLALAAGRPPVDGDGLPVGVAVRHGDVTRLAADDLAGADLITASALLDLFTADELDRFVQTCVDVGCPALITLSVVGRVELEPAEPLDARIRSAFNAHQRRPTDAGDLLGPDAVERAAERFTRLGAEVAVHASAWRLGAGDDDLAAVWFAGWVEAAFAQDPALMALDETYVTRRLDQARSGRLGITVEHADLLAVPA